MKLHWFNGVFMLDPEAMPDDLDIVFSAWLQNQKVVVLPVDDYEAMLALLPEGCNLPSPVDESVNPYRRSTAIEILDHLMKDQPFDERLQVFQLWQASKKDEYLNSKCSSGIGN